MFIIRKPTPLRGTYRVLQVTVCGAHVGVSFLARFAVESGNDLFFDGNYGAVSGEKTIAMDRRSVVIHAPIVGAAAAVPTNVMHAVKSSCRGSFAF